MGSNGNQSQVLDWADLPFSDSTERIQATFFTERFQG